MKNPIPTRKGNNSVELNNEKFSKVKEATAAMSGSILKYVMPSALPEVYENCERSKLAHPEHEHCKQHKIWMTQG